MSALKNVRLTVREQIKVREGRRSPYQVTWRVNGKERTQAFAKLDVAQAFQRDLRWRAEMREPFDAATLLPTSMSPSESSVSAIVWAKDVVRADWDIIAPTSSRGIVEGLATVLPGFVHPKIYQAADRAPEAVREARRRALERGLGKQLRPRESSPLTPEERSAVGALERNVLPLNELGHTQLQQALALARTRQDSTTPVSGSTFKRKYAALSKFFTTAVVQGHLERNPMKQLRATDKRSSGRSVKKRAPRVVSPQEAARLIEFASPESHRRVLELMLRAGLRPGEAMGLQVGDVTVDRSGRVILKLARSLTHVQAGYGGGRVRYTTQPLKHRRRGDERVVPLSSAFGERVLDWTQGQAGGDFLCATSSNTPVNPSNLSRTYAAARTRWVTSLPVDEQVGDDVMATPYSLRHAHATALMHAIPAPEAAARLGHDIHTLMSTYANVTADMHHTHNEQLDRLFE